jgi:hypothetical protein
MFQKIKDLFNKHHKNIKFAPGLSNSNGVHSGSSGNFKIKGGGCSSGVTRVRFAVNPVAAVHTY